MKLPLQIKVGYRTIDIVYASPEFRNDNMLDCYGQYLDKQSKIEIQPGLKPEEELNTIIHEVLHCVFKYIGETNDGMALADSTTEERVVLNTANVIQPLFFMDNPNLLVYITKLVRCSTTK
tara:strand:+ start:3331 stop:3693 length:363 start_codon:yes stop_codon:yes gene_type:complete